MGRESKAAPSKMSAAKEARTKREGLSQLNMNLEGDRAGQQRPAPQDLALGGATGSITVMTGPGLGS